MKTLCKPNNETDAISIQLLLEQNGIPALMKSFRDAAYDGLFQAQMGWGAIEVEDADFSRAGKLLREWESSDGEAE